VSARHVVHKDLPDEEAGVGDIWEGDDVATAKRVILHAMKMDAHASGIREINIAATNAGVGTVTGPTHQNIGHATHANEANERLTCNMQVKTWKLDLTLDSLHY